MPEIIDLAEGYRRLGIPAREVDAVAEALKWKQLAGEWERRALRAEGIVRDLLDRE